MRQAGRYHQHYQKLRSKHSFLDLCRNPKLACEVTLGPISEFDFDAAILFSDILFPLECLNFKVDFDPGPKLSWYLQTTKEIEHLKLVGNGVHQLSFQGEALKLIRAKLPARKGLLGFVGGPLTLFYFAALGTHKGKDLSIASSGLDDGRFQAFCNLLLDLLADNMILQAQNGADAIAMFDTCAGDISADRYREKVVPVLSMVFDRFKDACPLTPLIYYSKGTSPDYWNALKGMPISCLGVDSGHDLVSVLKTYGSEWSIQGNIDQNWLLLPEADLKPKLIQEFTKVKELPKTQRQGWICGLGHGVLPETPVTNVKLFLKLYKDVFGHGS